MLIVVAVIGGAVFVGGSYLVVFWRDTLRRWKLEKQADEKRKLKEANEEFIKATEQLNKIESEKKQ